MNSQEAIQEQDINIVIASDSTAPLPTTTSTEEPYTTPETHYPIPCDCNITDLPVPCSGCNANVVYNFFDKLFGGYHDDYSTQKPSHYTTQKPSHYTTQKPSYDITHKPSYDTTRKPSYDTTQRPSYTTRKPYETTSKHPVTYPPTDAPHTYPSYTNAPYTKPPHTYPPITNAPYYSTTSRPHPYYNPSSSEEQEYENHHYNGYVEQTHNSELVDVLDNLLKQFSSGSHSFGKHTIVYPKKRPSHYRHGYNHHFDGFNHQDYAPQYEGEDEHEQGYYGDEEYEDHSYNGFGRYPARLYR